LARYGLRLEPRAGALQLARYTKTDHLVTDPWLLPGFSFCRTQAGETLVQEVFSGSDAEARGLKGGERIVAVDGQSLVGLDESAMRAALIGGGLGHTVRLLRSGHSQELMVEVERVLPFFSF
ncbi:MAG: PDZ domain-containing protein, partial [Deltaproteobacteria bacterium]|nr:PDZ domain-containing protein [Deltaproteobacteria bacterium]